MFGSFGGGNEIYTGDIPASLRFRGRAVNAYTSRTFGTPTSQNSWAYSVWVKFSEMPNGANYQSLLSAGPVASSTWPGETLFLYQDGTLAYYASSSAGTHNVSKRSTRVFRDPTSWVHIFVRKTAAANSGLTFVRLWVNNEEITSWAVNAYTGTQASVPDYINVASTLHAGGRSFSGENLNGYKARECFVDNGGSLLPTDFGYFNPEINEWVSKSQSAVKAVVDAGGTNSFMLDFDDGSTLISELRSLGTNIGNGTTYGGLASAFDGTTSQILTASACTTGTNNLTVNVGKDWGVGVTRTIRKFKVYASSDEGFTNSTNKAVTLKLQGSTDNFASSVVDLYSTSFTSSAGQVVSVLSGIDTSTAYRYHRIQVAETSGLAAGHAVGITEIVFSEDVGLGKDLSSNLNNWTLNNFSLTAGTSYDWMLDVPGNSFATLNPINLSGRMPSITNGNLTLTPTGNLGDFSAGATISNSGSVLVYYEVVVDAWSGTSNVGFVGFGVTGQAIPANVSVSGFFGAIPGTGSWLSSKNGTTAAISLSGVTAGVVVSIAHNPVTGNVWIGKNGTWNNSGDPATGTNPTLTGLTGDYTPVVNVWQDVGRQVIFSANFGQRPFAYTPPTGYKALCQRNMPDPAILNPEKHFDVDTYTGTGSAINRTGFSLQPDFVWIKGRASAYTHALFDSVRGITQTLNSNTTDAEFTESAGTGLTALNSDGYSLGTNANDASTNVNAQTFAAWLWKAGGAAVTNNAGSISSQVSANVPAGFSIVTYTGNLTAAGTATVGHGLGRKPSLIISKSRNNAGGDSGQWCVRHQALDINSYRRLNTSDYIIDSVANGNMSAGHTTSVFQTNWTSGINSNGGNFVAYCFADIPGYSKAFWATGNGVADGPFIELGFKPKFILIIGGPAGAYWNIIDCTRSPYNVADLVIYPNTSGVENNTYAKIDILSSGIKCRAVNDNVNYNGYGIIGIAFADVPAKYALAR